MAETNIDGAGAAGVMFGPLTFPAASKPSDTFDWLTDEDVPCLLCDVTFVIPRDSAQLYQHLFTQHRLVIGDADRIASLKSYLRYWRVRLASVCVADGMASNTANGVAKSSEASSMADNTASNVANGGEASVNMASNVANGGEASVNMASVNTANGVAKSSEASSMANNTVSNMASNMANGGEASVNMASVNMAKGVAEFCFTLTMDVAPDGTPSPGEKYYMLADNLSEDKQLREGLQMKRLEHVLAVQEHERSDTDFSRGCLFCRQVIVGCRGDYLHHLAEQHNLQLGRTDNLVFIDRLLDTIQDKINRLECLFCEKLFKDRNVLKEHMRKKQHKRINPENTGYDKYFVVNYLEMGKDWHHLQSEPDEPDPGDGQAAEWDDWESEESEAPVVCLLCPRSERSFDDVLLHMMDEHLFDFTKQCHKLGLDFYQRVKLVNWMRRQVHCRACLGCDETFTSRELLLVHMNTAQHLTPPTPDAWNQPEYFFPTYENDSFLCHLEDSLDSDPIPEIGDLSLNPEENKIT